MHDPHNRTTFLGAKVVVLAVFVVLVCRVDPGRSDTLAIILAALVLVASSVSMGLAFSTWYRAQVLGVRLTAMLLDLATLVLGFSASYYLLRAGFEGLHSRIDAVYFTVTTLATVGFGDVHPTVDTTRALVAVQVMFAFTYLAVMLSSAAASVAGRLGGTGHRSDARHRDEPSTVHGLGSGGPRIDPKRGSVIHTAHEARPCG